MKEKLLEELLVIIESTKNFALEELPKVAEEILFYGAFEAGLIAASWGLLVLVSWSIAYGLYQHGRQKGDADTSLAAAIPITVSILPTIFVVENILVLGKVYFAPRLYLIEQISKMVL